MSDNQNAVTLTADDATATALVATIRASVNGEGKYDAYVAAHSVTSATVKDHAAALAGLVYPKDAPVQKKDGKRTRYGNAVQMAGAGLRRAIARITEPTPAETDYLKRIVSAVKAGLDHDVTPAQVEAVLADLFAPADN